MYGATITPALLFALFSKKVTKPAGVAGIVVGAVVTALWSLQNVAASGLLNLGFATLTFPVGIQPAVIAVPLAVAAILLTTLVTKKKEN
jgi:SSS family solute:Na+ symporter